MKFDALMAELPLIAILRRLTVDRAESVGAALRDAGVRIIEVPLNSPDPFKAIAALRAQAKATAIIGAGTVLTAAAVDEAHDAGAEFIVSPNVDLNVIERALKRDMPVLPGVFTPSECFAALNAGAVHLKLFPASTAGSGHLKAIKAVLPERARVHAVGGIGAGGIAEWVEAGADGFGFGGELFRREYTVGEIAARASRLVQAVQRAFAYRKQ